MMRDRRLGHVKMLGQFARSHLPVLKQLEDAPPRGVSQGLEYFVESHRVLLIRYLEFYLNIKNMQASSCCQAIRIGFQRAGHEPRCFAAPHPRKPPWGQSGMAIRPLFHYACRRLVSPATRWMPVTAVW